MALKKILVALSSFAATAVMAQALGTVSNVQGVVTATQGATGVAVTPGSPIVNGMRFVRVAIDCTLTERWQTTLMAHEIQHALEIGRRPEVDDVEAMEELYEEIGIPTVRDRAHRHFETVEAMAVQRAVEQDLEGRSTPMSSAY